MGSRVNDAIALSSLSRSEAHGLFQGARGVQTERYNAVLVPSKQFVEVKRRRGARNLQERSMRCQTPFDKHSNTVRIYCVAFAHVRWRRVPRLHEPRDAAASNIDHTPVLNLNHRFRSFLPDSASSSKVQKPLHRMGG
jgi:hypothetical protein